MASVPLPAWTFARARPSCARDERTGFEDGDHLIVTGERIGRFAGRVGFVRQAELRDTCERMVGMRGRKRFQLVRRRGRRVGLLNIEFLLRLEVTPCAVGENTHCHEAAQSEDGGAVFGPKNIQFVLKAGREVGRIDSNELAIVTGRLGAEGVAGVVMARGIGLWNRGQEQNPAPLSIPLFVTKPTTLRSAVRGRFSKPPLRANRPPAEAPATRRRHGRLADRFRSSFLVFVLGSS